MSVCRPRSSTPPPLHPCPTRGPGLLGRGLRLHGICTRPPPLRRWGLPPPPPAQPLLPPPGVALVPKPHPAAPISEDITVRTSGGPGFRVPFPLPPPPPPGDGQGVLLKSLGPPPLLLLPLNSALCLPQSAAVSGARHPACLTGAALQVAELVQLGRRRV